MAFPERLGVVDLVSVQRVARRCATYADHVGEVLLAVDADRVCWVTWPHNSAARKILRHMPETVLGTWKRGVSREDIEWEIWQKLQVAA